jgi:hypothetical protein
MRRTLSLAIALALLVFGSGALVYLLFFSQGWRGWMILAALLVAGLGAAWLWSDFIDATPNEDR